MASYIDETSITNLIQEINILSNYIQDINNLYNVQDINNLYNNVKESLMNPLVNLVSTNNNIQIPNFPEHSFKPITWFLNHNKIPVLHESHYLLPPTESHYLLPPTKSHYLLSAFNIKHMLFYIIFLLGPLVSYLAHFITKYNSNGIINIVDNLVSYLAHFITKCSNGIINIVDNLVSYLVSYIIKCSSNTTSHNDMSSYMNIIDNTGTRTSDNQAGINPNNPNYNGNGNNGDNNNGNNNNGNNNNNWIFGRLIFFNFRDIINSLFFCIRLLQFHFYPLIILFIREYRTWYNTFYTALERNEITEDEYLDRRRSFILETRINYTINDILALRAMFTYWLDQLRFIILPHEHSISHIAGLLILPYFRVTQSNLDLVTFQIEGLANISMITTNNIASLYYERTISRMDMQASDIFSINYININVIREYLGVQEGENIIDLIGISFDDILSLLQHATSFF
jgi:hypothetical protein